MSEDTIGEMSEALVLPLVNLNNSLLPWSEQAGLGQDVTRSWSPKRGVPNGQLLEKMSSNSGVSSRLRNLRSYSALLASMNNITNSQLRSQLIRSAPPIVHGERLRVPTFSARMDSSAPATTPMDSRATSARSNRLRLHSAVRRSIRNQKEVTFAEEESLTFRMSKKKSDLFRDRTRIYQHTQSTLRKVQKPFVFEEFTDDSDYEWSRLSLYDVHRRQFWNSNGTTKY